MPRNSFDPIQAAAVPLDNPPPPPPPGAAVVEVVPTSPLPPVVDLKIEPPAVVAERFRVKTTRYLNIPGAGMTKLAAGSIVSAATHDLGVLREQGFDLVPVEAAKE